MIEIYVSREVNLQGLKEKCFGIIWGQCISGLQYRTEGLTDYDDKYEDLDVLWLIQELKKLTSIIDSKSNTRLTLRDALASLYILKQGETKPTAGTLKSFVRASLP